MFPINLALSILAAYAKKRICSGTWIIVLRYSIALVQVMCSHSSCPGHFSHGVSQKGYHITSLQGLGDGYRDILLRSLLIHRPAKRSVVSCCLQLLHHSGTVSASKTRPCSSLGDLWAVTANTRTGTKTELSLPISGFFHDPEHFPGLAKTWSGLPEGLWSPHAQSSILFFTFTWATPNKHLQS